MKTFAYLMLILMALTFVLTLSPQAAADDDDGGNIGGSELFRSAPFVLFATEEDDGGTVGDSCE